MQFAKIQTQPTVKQDGRIHLSHQSTTHPLGKLLLLINVNLQQLTGLPRLENFVKYASEEYYAGPPTDQIDNAAESRLEDLLGKINKNYQTFLPGLKLSETDKTLSCFIGVIKENELFFTKTGRLKILLQHEKSLIDISRQAAEDEDVASQSALFSFISAGKISANDSLLTATASLLDYFSENKLRQTLAEGDADMAGAELAKLVEEFAKHTFFQGIIIKNASVAAPAITKVKIAGEIAQTSMTDLNTLRAKTGDLLNSNFFNSFKKSFYNLSLQIKGLFSGQDRGGSSTNDSELAIKRRIRQKNLILRLGNKLWLIVRSLLLVIYWLVKQLITLFANLIKNRRAVVGSVRKNYVKLPEMISRAWHLYRGKFQSLNHRRRIILSVSGGLIIILIISVITGISNNSSTLSEAEALTILDEIEIKRASAEAALIYGNEKQAVSQIAEARRLLNNLNISDKQLVERKSVLADNLFNSYKAIQKLTELSQPALLADLGEDDAGQQLTMVALAGTGANFYGYNTDNTIYKFSVADLAGTALAKLNVNIAKLNILNDTELLVYQSEPTGTVEMFNVNNLTLEPLDINFNNPLTQKNDFESYFSRLYVLDPRERQIYRHQQVGASYSRGTPWLTDGNVDIADALDMAIDGNVWVVTSSGQIYRLSGGVKEDFDISIIDPILNSPNFIWTNIDSSRVYVLDPPTRRVIILNKDGSIFKQFVSEHFDDLKSAVIDELNNRIYILNASQVYELDI